MASLSGRLVRQQAFQEVKAVHGVDKHIHSEASGFGKEAKSEGSGSWRVTPSKEKGLANPGQPSAGCRSSCWCGFAEVGRAPGTIRGR